MIDEQHSDNRLHSRDLDVPSVVCGHTHMQFDRGVGATRIVNAGSAGIPFGEAGTHWLLLEPDIVLRRTPYDLPGAAARFSATSYPRAKPWSDAPSGNTV